MKTSRAVAFGWAVFAAVAVLGAGAASADPFGSAPAASGGWSPRVPISALARPMAGLDLTRFHMSTTVSVGSGFSGGAAGLQTTSFSYQFRTPLAMSVSIGNAFGPTTTRGGNSFFLQGLDLAYRPTANTAFSVHYQNLRSPLQYGYSPFGYGPEYFGQR